MTAATYAATARRIADTLDVATPTVTVVADASTPGQPLAEVRSHGSRPAELFLSSRATGQLRPQSITFLLAHELAHLSRPIARRRRRRRLLIALLAAAAAVGIVIAFPDAHIWARSFAGALAALVVFVLIDNRLNHNEEYACDRAAAEITGADAGLRMLEVMEERRRHHWLVDALGAHPPIAARRTRLASTSSLAARKSEVSDLAAWPQRDDLSDGDASDRAGDFLEESRV